MNIKVGELQLRSLEERDLDALHRYKNDPDIAAQLGGFSTGYSRKDLDGWLEYHRNRSDEILWSIATTDGDDCIGHVGLYQIDHRVRKAEFAIMIGDHNYHGRGLGKQVTAAVIAFGTSDLNLRRIELSVLSTNQRAINLYKSLGFDVEGTQREAQFKDGRYVDVVLMALLKTESR